MRFEPRRRARRGEISLPDRTPPSRTPWSSLVSVGLFALCVAGLASIATPNFRASRERANERAANANLKTVAGALEMYNLDFNTRVGAVSPRLLQELQRKGYIQAVPDMEFTMKHASQGFALREGVQYDPEGHQGQVLPSEGSWLDGVSSVPVPVAAPASRHPSAPVSPPRVEPSARLAEMTEVSRDPLSTFAMDVDTASYTMARAELEGGRLPAPPGVRVEEFVNFFDYEDRAPERDAFAVHVQGAPTPLPGARPGTYLVRVGLKAREISRQQRPPLRLTFVVDCSGSMNDPSRLPLVKQGLSMLVDQLREGDSVGLVVYGSRARVHLPPTSARRRRTILAAIEALETEGVTNLEAGLSLGYSLAAEAFQEGASNRVVLCTDGLANQGLTRASAILERIRADADRGLYMTVVGFGLGAQDSLMEELADDGDGAYAYVDRIEEARRLFVQDLTGTLVTVARDAKIQVQFDPARVRRYRLLGYENREVADRDFRNDAVDAGEVGAGHAVSALYELELVPGAAGEQLGTVRVRFQEPDGDRVTEIQEPLRQRDLAPTPGRAGPRWRLAACVAGFAEALRASPEGQGPELQRLEVEALALARELGDPEVEELALAIGRARLLGRQGR